MQITRRDLAAALLATAPAAAQSTPEDLNAAARANLKNNAAAMAKVDLPMDVEPAFQFKA